MQCFRLNKNWIMAILGIGSDEGADETQAETINVRLEEMFREAVQDVECIIHLHREELQKLHTAGKVWRDGSKTLKTPDVIVDRDKGFRDEHLRELNLAPVLLARQLQQDGRLVFCHAPVLQYRRVGRIFHLCVAMNIIYAPYQEKSREPESKDVPGVDGRVRGRGGASYPHDAEFGELSGRSPVE